MNVRVSETKVNACRLFYFQALFKIIEVRLASSLQQRELRKFNMRRVV